MISPIDPNWYPATDGVGFALVPASDGQPGAALADAGGWRAGTTLGGTPGRPEPAAIVFPDVVINEVLAHTDPPLARSIEILNRGATEADIGGWFLSDDRRTPKYMIPLGTRLQPGAYYVRTEADFNPTPGAPSSFNLRASGDEVYLFSADATGHLTGYSQGLQLRGGAKGSFVWPARDQHG